MKISVSHKSGYDPNDLIVKKVNFMFESNTFYSKTRTHQLTHLFGAGEGLQQSRHKAPRDTQFEGIFAIICCKELTHLARGPAAGRASEM